MGSELSTRLTAAPTYFCLTTYIQTNGEIKNSFVPEKKL